MADALITVASVTVTAGVRQNTIRWTVSIGSCQPYMALAVFEVWAASTNNRASAAKIGDTTDLSFTHPGLLIGVPRYYWVRAKDVSGQYSDYSPLSATSGVSGTPTSTGTGSVGSDELADNSVGGNHLKADSVTASKIDVDELAAISATLGNVTVNGSLLVNGTVSAGKYADLSIDTGKVIEDAITTVYTGGGDSQVSASNSSGTWTTLATASNVEVPSHSKVIIWFSASGEYGNQATNEFRIRRDSTQIAILDGQYISTGSGGKDDRRHNTAYQRKDTPSGGTYDYEVQVRSKETTFEAAATRWKYRRIVAFVGKR